MTGPAPRPWTAKEDAALVDLHTAYSGDWRKVAPKIGRTPEACRTRYRQVVVHKPKRVEVERRCLSCLRTRMIPAPMRVCDGCKDSETWRNGSALA